VPTRDKARAARKQLSLSGVVIERAADDEHGTVTVIEFPVSRHQAVRHGPPSRQRNKARRTREYLTPAEVETLMKAARDRGRNGHRDATMIMIAYQHGLRASELVKLTWQQIDLSDKVMHITRAKNGVPSVHPMTGEEMRSLRRVYREQADRGRVRPLERVFQTEQGTAMTEAGFRKMLYRAAETDIELQALNVHPHMLRHAAGYKLANDGHDTRSLQHYLGHRNIQHTTRYTELASGRFEGWW